MPTENAQYHYDRARRLLLKAEDKADERSDLLRLAEVHLAIWRTLREPRRPGYTPSWTYQGMGA